MTYLASGTSERNENETPKSSEIHRNNIVKKLLYQEITKDIRQGAYEVHKYFGSGFLEKVYENALAYKIRQSGYSCQQQAPIKVFFENNVIVGEYFADILVEDKIIIEIKVSETIQKVHYAQLQNYLKATRIRLGLLINFGKEKLQFKRAIL